MLGLVLARSVAYIAFVHNPARIGGDHVAMAGFIGSSVSSEAVVGLALLKQPGQPP
jgi:hypothetical protein